MRSILMPCVPNFLGSDFFDVAYWITANLIDDTLIVKVALSGSVDLHWLRAEFAHDCASIKAQFHWLEILDAGVIYLVVAWVLNPLMHLLSIYTNLLGKSLRIIRDLIRWEINQYLCQINTTPISLLILDLIHLAFDFVVFGQQLLIQLKHIIFLFFIGLQLFLEICDLFITLLFFLFGQIYLLLQLRFKGFDVLFVLAYYFVLRLISIYIWHLLIRETHQWWLAMHGRISATVVVAHLYLKDYNQKLKI